MSVRKIDAGLYVEEPGPEREFYCWAPPDDEEGTGRVTWYVLDSADDAPSYVTDPDTGELQLVIKAVAGPFDLGAAITKSAQLNAELEAGAK